ncbi:hypothetical protein Tco_0599949 [Tanacetum coccineum]
MDRPDKAGMQACTGRQKKLRMIGNDSALEFENCGKKLCSRSHLGKGSLELPQELSRVHHTFHVSNLKKCYADEPLVTLR